MMNIPVRNDNLFSVIKKEDSKKVSFDEFKDKITNDINKKLEIKNDNSLKQKIFGEKYFLDEIKDIFTEKKFDDILKMQEMYDNDLYPVLTFHATTNINKVNSIVKFGYLIPGHSTNPINGWNLYASHGASYGEGIYVTTFFDIVTWLSFVDKNDSIQLIVNLTFLGKTKIVNRYQYNDISKKQLKEAKNNTEYNTEKNDINNYTIPSYLNI
jgi:hypothetical protein